MNNNKIPKIIHYCWFGHGKYDAKIIRCINTWEKLCPDYRLMKWSEENFDLDSCEYVRQAYDRKRWAFVTDYVRFKVLHEYGGIYLDTDMELIKPVDELLSKETIFSFKQTLPGPSSDLHGLTSGIIGSVPGNPLFQPLIDQFENRAYIKEDGQEDFTPIAKFLTELLLEHGIRLDDSFQYKDGIAVYPHEYLCPTVDPDGTIHATENTLAVHHFTGSWRTPEIMEMILEKIRNAKEGDIVV